MTSMQIDDKENVGDDKSSTEDVAGQTLKSNSEVAGELASNTRLAVSINSWTSVAVWRWTAKDDSCGICRMPFDAACSACAMPGDDCPLVWGVCTHVFHQHCIDKWCHTGQQQASGQSPHCPMCRQPWHSAPPVAPATQVATTPSSKLAMAVAKLRVGVVLQVSGSSVPSGSANASALRLRRTAGFSLDTSTAAPSSNSSSFMHTPSFSTREQSSDTQQHAEQVASSSSSHGGAQRPDMPRQVRVTISDTPAAVAQPQRTPEAVNRYYGSNRAAGFMAAPRRPTRPAAQQAASRRMGVQRRDVYDIDDAPPPRH